MTKARAYVKSVKSRGSLACAFLARAWGKLLCRWNWHDDGMGIWSRLELIEGEQCSSVVGDRIVWTCDRCGSCVQHDRFVTIGARNDWMACPDKRRVTLRDWSKS